MEAATSTINAAFRLEDIKRQSVERTSVEDIGKIIANPADAMFVLTVDAAEAEENLRESPGFWTGTTLGTRVVLPPRLGLPAPSAAAQDRITFASKRVVVGTVLYRQEDGGKMGYMGMLAVHPTQFRRGYGNILMDHVEQLAMRGWAGQENCQGGSGLTGGNETLRLCYVDMAGSTTKLGKIYGRRGFVKIGTHLWTKHISEERVSELLRPSCRGSFFTDMAKDLGADS